MPEATTEDDEQDGGGAHPFWSGTIAFGLVSLPVNLFVANRARAVSFRMLDQDGTPLARRYFCTRDEKPLTQDDLVRGYEVEGERFIEIKDEELEALAPDKSREIDLRRFVPLDAIDPMFFERAYLLIPEEGASKAYRLLAESMEEMNRAGIATVVMRGKEYLVAIIAERGILRAETLRFKDELRTLADVGLPSLRKPAANEVHAIKRAIASLSAARLDRAELADESSQRLLELVERKLKTGKDVVHAPAAPEVDEGAEIIDLMEVLKKSLAAKADGHPARPRRSPAQEKPRASSSSKAEVGADTTKEELYKRAKVLDVPGRSHMSKQQLLRAIEKSGARR